MKITFYSILAILLASCLLIYFTTSDYGVSGEVAFKIAAESNKYLAMAFLSIAGSIAAIIWCVKNSWDEDGKGIGVIVAATVIMFICILLRPINIKNDFQSANITSEQIQYIKDHLQK